MKGKDVMRLRILSLAAISAALTLSSSPAHADYLNGNDLYKDCRNDDVAYQRGCAFFIFGVVGEHQRLTSTVNYWAIREDPPKPQLSYAFCLRDRVTGGQLVEVVTQYLQDNPANRDSPATALVIAALAEAWPCSVRDD